MRREAESRSPTTDQAATAATPLDLLTIERYGADLGSIGWERGPDQSRWGRRLPDPRCRTPSENHPRWWSDDEGRASGPFFVALMVGTDSYHLYEAATHNGSLIHRFRSTSELCGEPSSPHRITRLEVRFSPDSNLPRKPSDGARWGRYRYSADTCAGPVRCFSIWRRRRC